MKCIVVLSIVFNLCIVVLQHKQERLPVTAIAADSTVYYKLNAFSVLQNKCNVCHSERNRDAVFTFANMNTWSGKINEQVFIKKRMPKGNTIVLTDADKIHLRKWLQSIAKTSK